MRDCSADMEYALAALGANDTEAAVRIFKHNTDALVEHKGFGSIHSYVEPCRLLKNVLFALHQAGFPYGPILTSSHNADILQWLEWPEACTTVVKQTPSYLVNLLTYGITEEAFAPSTDGENYEISLDYLPGALQRQYKEALGQYVDTVEDAEVWLKRLRTVIETLRTHAPNQCPTRQQCLPLVEQLKELGASELDLVELFK